MTPRSMAAPLEEEDQEPRWSDFTWREHLLALVTLVMILLAVLFGGGSHP